MVFYGSVRVCSSLTNWNRPPVVVLWAVTLLRWQSNLMWNKYGVKRTDLQVYICAIGGSFSQAY
jgi:hypothetical protein